MVAAEGATWVDIEINVTSMVSIRSQDAWTCRRGWNARRWMQELCLKNCDQDAAGQKLENLSKGGMVWEQTVYRKGFLPCRMLVASAVKAPRLAIPLASNNELTRMSVQVGQHYMALPAQLHASAALAPYCLKNCDADRGMVWERARSSRREGRGPGGRASPKEE